MLISGITVARAVHHVSAAYAGKVAEAGWNHAACYI
jgi:hypothetical protein